MFLTQQERESPLWQKIVEYLDERIATHRKQNDNPKPELETAMLRGQIKEALALKDLGREPIEINAKKKTGSPY